MNHHKGLGLMELMISLCLSSILLTFLMGHFVISKRQYHQSAQLLAQELELGLVSQLLRDSIRAAGFTPCLGLDHLVIKDTRETLHPISALRASTQSLTLSGMNEHYRLGLSQESPLQILLSGDCSLGYKRPIMIADCFHAEIHRMQNCQQKGENALISLTKPLEFTYPTSFYVSDWVEEHFFIAKNDKGDLAFFYGNLKREELTANIQGWEVSYEKPLVTINLILKDRRQVLLETRMRNP